MLPTVLEVLQEQYLRQRSYLSQTHGTPIANRSQLQQYARQTRDMIETRYRLRYDDKLGKWTKTRKPRLRPLKKNQVVEIWVTNRPVSQIDELCKRFAGEMYNQGEGPLPDQDTHPHCKCRRVVCAVPNDKGRLQWAIKKPRSMKKPKIRLPQELQEPANPYDVDSIQAPAAVFA